MVAQFDQAFAAGQLIKEVKTIFNRQYDPALATSTINWLNKPLTDKMLDEKKRFYTLQGERERIVHQYEMEQDPINTDRKNLLQELAETTSANKTTMKSQTIIFRSILSAFNKLSSRNLTETQIDGIVQNYRQQIQSQIDQGVIDQASTMFYNVDDKAMRDYLSFYQSEAGHWLSSTTADGIHTALQSAADRFNKAVAGIE